MSEFREYHPRLSKYTAEQIGRVLEKMHFEVKRKTNGRYRLLPSNIIMPQTTYGE